MLCTIAIVLIILWLVGFVVFPVVGGLIHILLVIALIMIVLNLVRGRRVL
ncbi:MAG: lmo0937 family membrane protein [Ignavibacteriaceae bacterium]